ncbi:hypothetical protein D3C79_725150 [compost metagenome]
MMSPVSTNKTEQKPAAPTPTVTGVELKSTKRFYQNEHLVTVMSTQGHRHIVRTNDTPLVQLENEKASKIFLVDLANSMLGVPPESVAYSPYGYPSASKATSLIAFAGQPWDPMAQAYPLGKGHRQLHSRLGRLGSPDTLSPFDEGGLNAYTYCGGDPINREDSTGKSPAETAKLITGTAKLINRKNASGNLGTIPKNRPATRISTPSKESSFTNTRLPRAKKSREIQTGRDMSTGDTSAVRGLAGKHPEYLQLERDGHSPTPFSEIENINALGAISYVAPVERSPTAGYKTRNIVFGVVAVGTVIAIMATAVGLGIWLEKRSKIRES